MKIENGIFIDCQTPDEESVKKLVEEKLNFSALKKFFPEIHLSTPVEIKNCHLFGKDQFRFEIEDGTTFSLLKIDKLSYISAKRGETTYYYLVSMPT